REQQQQLDLLGFMQQVDQMEEAFLQQLQGTQAQLTDTAAALEAAHKDLAVARTELAHTKRQLTTTSIKLEQLRAQVATANKGFSKDQKDKWKLLMRSRERDTHTGGYTAEYILSRERLLCLPGVLAEQLGTLCTAVVGAVFPGADPGRQASATTHRRNHDLLQTYIHEAHTGNRQAGRCAKSKLLVCAHMIAVWLRRAFAVHVQLDGCTIPAHGKVVLYRVTAAVRCFSPSLAAAAGSPCPAPTAAAGSPSPASAPLPTAHTPEVQEARVDSAAGNIGRISGLAVSINALRRQQGLALIIFWPCVSHQIHNALHKAMTTWGKAEGWGRQGLQAQLALSIEQLCSLTKKHWDLLGLSVQHCAQPSEPSQSRWGSYVDACSSLTRVLKPVTAAVTGIMQRQGKAAPAWAGDLCSLLLDTDLICKLMVVAVVGQQLVMPELGWVATEGGMHAFELARHVEQLLDNLLDASTQDAEERFPYIFKHAQGLFVATAPSAHTAVGALLTAAASDPNPMALEGQQWAAAKPKLVVLINKHIQALYEYLYEHSQLFFQLPHLLAAMGSSNALYAQKAAEQVLKQRDMRLQQWDVHQREKQQQQQGGRRQAPSGQQLLPFDPAVFDPYGTLQDFLDDIHSGKLRPGWLGKLESSVLKLVILELAAGQPCSPGLRTHLVEFFGAAPSSNHAVESSLQHTKHGNSAKQGLDAMIGSINNKLDPGALANIDLADFEARLLTLRKQKRDKETTSADDNREAKAARKTEESACMVDGNAKMVLNVPTHAPHQQLQQAFQQHARGADYSNTSAKEATRFTRELDSTAWFELGAAPKNSTSPGLRTHLVEFFGAAPSSNHAVESSLQHTKHGNSAKQGLDAMIGSINNKLDPGALANIDLADFEARLLTLRKQKRDKETTSADDNREAKAARKTEESACMVDGNAKMVLNVPTHAPHQQLQQAFQQHARGADYSNTSAKEATRFTREQLRAYLLYHKVPPRDQPVGNTLVAGWQKAVQKHIAERGSPTGHGVFP
ncbi:hypothetical protein QJQ45_023948, partial [Haematococcus lacustris]